MAVCWIGCSEPVLDEPVRRLGPDAITAFDVALPLDVGEGGPSDGPGVPDGGPFDGPGAPDGGMVPDGGGFDGGMPDGGGVPDGGGFDGGLPDGGGVPDGGMPDGGLPDGGLPDGGMPDGGMPDGGMPDGGMPDGGMIQVAPSPLDFMEVRKGTGTRELAVAIRNPGAVAATISAIRLAQAPGELALDGSPTAVVPPGGEIARTLRLATTRELELTNTTLEIDVDGQQLAYPVTGKVVTPEVHVTPAELDLGTACIGTPITGTVMMTNTGTARLAMEPPELDGGFTATYQSPTSYPAPLLAGTTALLGVSADPSAAGAFDGRLRWQVDAPGAPFEIPLHVEYIDVGTAVSPARLDFGPVEVGAVSFRSTVVLQNCNSSPVALTVDGIHVRQGPITAWDVQPRYDQRTLAPHETMTITAAFAPTRGGRHTAVIKIDIDGLSHFVELTALATGYTPDRTSFYACASGPDAPAAGGPIAAAIAVIVLRRRRRTCS
ncbi:MAG: choice-of-anchor D domain-containing protein [Kofleriaceae bacterium]